MNTIYRQRIEVLIGNYLDIAEKYYIFDYVGNKVPGR